MSAVKPMPRCLRLTGVISNFLVVPGNLRCQTLFQVIESFGQFLVRCEPIA